MSREHIETPHLFFSDLKSNDRNVGAFCQKVRSNSLGTNHRKYPLSMGPTVTGDKFFGDHPCRENRSGRFVYWPIIKCTPCLSKSPIEIFFNTVLQNLVFLVQQVLFNGTDNNTYTENRHIYLVYEISSEDHNFPYLLQRYED